MQPIKATLLMASLLMASPAVLAWDGWQETAFADLCRSYLNSAPPQELDAAERSQWLDRLFVEFGKRMTAGGSSGIPAQDMAMLALLQARSAQAPASAAPAPETTPFAQQAVTAQAAAKERQAGVSDLSKGEEGIRQAQERLEQMPIGERMVITGDVASAVQAATIQGNTDLASTVGRARVNFVLRALAGSPRKGLGDGYFFVQMLAAGGAPDTSVVGGPASFTPLNDIAADRSAFNESTYRGNLYLSKVFYQQQMDFGESRLIGRAGIMDFSDYFDGNTFANNEARQFLNAALVNGAAFKSGIVAPGMMAAYHRRLRGDTFRSMTFRGGYAISRTDRAFTSPLWSSEVELMTLLAGLEGHWRIGGTFGNLADAGGYRGLHLSADQWLNSRTGVFGRIGFANSGPGSLAFGPVRRSYSAGMQLRIGEDRRSAVSFGYSHSVPIATGNSLASERLLEAYYRMQLTDMISVTPDFQLILGSGGRKTRGTHAVYGIRLNFGY